MSEKKKEERILLDYFRLVFYTSSMHCPVIDLKISRNFI